jgi:carbonic anhydrase
MAAALVSKRKFDPSHPDALAVYCSDGRFTHAVEELLGSIGHERLDTMTLPGGPALFELTTADFAGLEAVRTAASFLVRGHAIKHVVLLAHEGCGYYRGRNPGAEPQALLEKQVDDLRSAARWFHGAMPHLDIRLYYARITRGEKAHVAFHLVEER